MTASRSFAPVSKTIFCGKLLGLPMGVDICYTNHAEADRDDMDALLTLLAAAGCTYIMGVPGADDIMLGYQSTSFHDAWYVRRLFGLRPAPEFEEWMIRRGLLDESGRLLDADRGRRLLETFEARPEKGDESGLKMENNFVHRDPWRSFGRYTQARIALGRAGSAIPTKEHLALQLAEARARDAVNAELDVAGLAGKIHASLDLDVLLVKKPCSREKRIPHATGFGTQTG